MRVLRDQTTDNDSKKEWKLSLFTSEISEQKDFFTYFLKVEGGALLLRESLPTGISFSFSMEFFNARQQ